MDFSKKWVMVLVAIFCSLLWGSAFPALKLTYTSLHVSQGDTIAQMVLAGIRFFLAGLIVMSGLFLFKKESLFVQKSSWGVIVLFGMIQTALQYFFFYIGVSHTSGVQSAILTSSNTFFTILIAHFMYTNDRMNGQKIVGLMVGFLGILIANWGQSFTLQFSLFGEGFILLSALTSAIGTIMAKQISGGIHPFALSGWQLTIGGAILLVISFPLLEKNTFNWSILGVTLIVYMALLSAVAFALWYAILQYHKASHVGIYKFFVPISGVFLSVILLPNEPFTIQIVFALLFIVIGIFLVNRS